MIQRHDFQVEIGIHMFDLCSSVYLKYEFFMKGQMWYHTLDKPMKFILLGCVFKTQGAQTTVGKQNNVQNVSSCALKWVELC